ncbi:hypothetical protein cypCar_00043516, partial [Cyprinus carpio]
CSDKNNPNSKRRFKGPGFFSMMGSIDFGLLMEIIEARDEWLDDDFPR